MKNLKINLPQSWGDLSQKQLRTVFKYFASESLSMYQCKLLLALKFAGISYFGKSGEDYLVRYQKETYLFTEQQMMAMAHALDFLESDPQYPVRLYELKFRKAVHPLLRELTFAQWLGIENLYFGFINTKDPALMNEVLSILYPQKGFRKVFVKSFNSRKTDFRIINAIYWLSSFKRWLTSRYRELFSGMNDENKNDSISGQKLMESMNAQIRALTKGDITKKETVLEMDIHSALEELDALALEARKIKESFKKNK